MSSPPLSRPMVSVLPEVDTGRPPLLFVAEHDVGASAFALHWLPASAAAGYPAHAVSVPTSLRDGVEEVRRAAASLSSAPVLLDHGLGGAVVLLLLDQEPAPAGVLLAPSRLPRRRRVGKVDVPLLVIGTPDDPEVPSDDVRRTAREQGVVPVWFPGLGHDLMLGAGQERVLETVLEWVGRAALGGTGTR